MLSAPPATMISASPALIIWAARDTALSPDPQTLLRVNAGTCLLYTSYQRYYLLSTDFCIFFCLFSISFLRGFCGLSQESGPAGPYPLQTLASSPLQKDPQGLRSSENTDGQPLIIMYENLGSGSESLQKSGFFHIPHTCPPALWYIIVRNGKMCIRDRPPAAPMQ